MTTVAVIDDEPHIARSWSSALEDAGYRVRMFHGAKPALEQLAADPPDVLVVDHHLTDDMPELDGYGLLLKLRREWSARSSEVKVIIVSAVRTDVVDRVIAAKVADEFMKKERGDAPLLVHLVDKVNRDRRPDERISTIRRSGRLMMDEAARVCRWQGKKVELNQGAEWAIMWTLLEKPGTTRTQDDLANSHNVDKNSIRDMIGNIRKKLARIDGSFKPIETVRGVGYKLEDQQADQ